jgi:hypothetical protein
MEECSELGIFHWGRMHFTPVEFTIGRSYEYNTQGLVAARGLGWRMDLCMSEVT